MRTRFTVFVTMLTLLSLSCSTLGGLIGGATETPTPAIAGSSSSGADQTVEPSDPGDQPGPAVTAESTAPGGQEDEREPTPSPDESESSQCLVGRWRADHESFAGYLENAFETPAEGLIDFEFETGRGDLFLEFTEGGEMSMEGEDFQIDLAIVGLASFTFVLQADGSATYAADDRAIAIWGVDYESETEGEGEVLSLPEIGAEAVLDITPEGLFGYARSEGYTYRIERAPADAGHSPYQCSGDTLILGPEGFQPVRWERVSN